MAFKAAGGIIDSGTVITRLPQAAYAALRPAFREGMRKYPRAPSNSVLDTCYDFRNYATIDVPAVSFFFNGGVEVSLDVTGTMYVIDASQVCLAFAGYEDETRLTIFGNVQQKTLEGCI